jgi:hypothetical protein
MITKQQNVNPAFGSVNNPNQLQAELATGPIRVQESINANLRKAEQARTMVADFKRKKKEKELTNNALSYLSNLNSGNDQAAKQATRMYGLDGNEEENKIAIKALGGPAAAIKLINETSSAIQTQQASLIEKQLTEQAKVKELQPALYTAEEVENLDESASVTPVMVPQDDGTTKRMFEVSNINVSAKGTSTIPGLEELGSSTREDRDGDGFSETILTKTGENSVSVSTIDPPVDPNEEIATKAAIEADKDYVKEVNKWEQGGSQVALENILGLESVRLDLVSGVVKTGTLLELIPSDMVRDAIRPIANKRGQQAVDAVRNVIFKSLKAILGGAFTEREGENLVKNAYNPALSNELNADRLARAINVLKQTEIAKRDKVDYFRRNGTTKGYQGLDATAVLVNGNLTFEQSSAEQLGQGLNVPLKAKQYNIEPVN